MYTPNPYQGRSDWQEFKYDMTHLRQWWQRNLAGLRGELPHVSDQDAFCVKLLLIVAVLICLGGLVMIALG
jgi:hypothetical protein